MQSGILSLILGQWHTFINSWPSSIFSSSPVEILHEYCSNFKLERQKALVLDLGPIHFVVVVNHACTIQDVVHEM